MTKAGGRMATLSRGLGFLTGFALVLSACAQDPVQKATEEARKAMLLKLADPGSAEFSDVSSKDGIICGLVNAKNQLGAYIGYRGFYVEGGEATLDSAKPNLKFEKSFDKKCPSGLTTKYFSMTTDLVIQALKDARK